MSGVRAGCHCHCHLFIVKLILFSRSLLLLHHQSFVQLILRKYFYSPKIFLSSVHKSIISICCTRVVCIINHRDAGPVACNQLIKSQLFIDINRSPGSFSQMITNRKYNSPVSEVKFYWVIIVEYWHNIERLATGKGYFLWVRLPGRLLPVFVCQLLAGSDIGDVFPWYPWFPWLPSHHQI